ncbi:MAG TPA: MarR family transcriptional regulator [Burkholderiales bacterium]|nr:MarR family transcriptional regulator [Burkholderiales bacterium]
MDPRRSFGFLLKDASRLYVQRFEQHAREHALTLDQCKALVNLAKNEGISQRRLSQLADIKPMNLVRILDRMQADGWLERRADPADRRARRLFLRSKAKPLVEEIWQLADLTRGEAFAGIGKRQRELFVEQLERIRANLASLEKPRNAARKPARAAS